MRASYVVLCAAVLTVLGGAATASTWGSYGWDYDRSGSYSWDKDYGSDHEYSWEWCWEDTDKCLYGCGEDGETPEVPLPAAGFLLLAGLGGIAALKRRKS